MKPGDTSKRSLGTRFNDAMQRAGKALSATPAGLLTLQSGNAGITADSSSAFAGSGYFGFPRSAFMDGYYYTLQNASYAYMWQTQPNLRMVVGYLASNWAQVPLQLLLDTDKGVENDRLHPAMASIRSPNEWQDTTELLEMWAGDYFVFDNAYLVKIRPQGADRTTLVRVPAYAMGVRGVNKLRPDGYRIIYSDGTFESLDPSEVIHWRGYNALDPRSGWSKIETLRQEMISEAMRMQADIDFSKGGRVRGGIIERPLEAPEWSPTAAKRFEEGWASRARASNQGKSPVLEDGMKWIDAGVTPREAEALAMKEASVAAVCRAYSLHPSLFGVGTLRELADSRKMTNEEILPPLFKRCAGVLTKTLVEAEYGDDEHYFKFDLTEKLEGSPLDRLKNAVTISGRAFLTANEVRKMFGYPPIEGGDVLVTPANVLTGASPSPHTMPPAHAVSNPGTEPSAEQVPSEPVHGPSANQAKKGEDAPVRFSCSRPPLDPTIRAPERFQGLRPADGDVHTKALTRREATRERTTGYADAYTAIVRKHMRRQASSLTGKASVPALDSERWNAELAADLLPLMVSTVETEGARAGERLMGGFDTSRVEHYMEAGAKAIAEGVNTTTAREVQEAVQAASLKADSIQTAEGALAVAGSGRAEQIGKTLATRTVSFAVNEAARQNPGEGGTIRLKEWVGTGRAGSRHNNLSGEAVPVYSPFSNGMLYPGDPTGGPDQCSNCDCVLDVF